QDVFKQKTGFDAEVAGDDEMIKGNIKIIPLGEDDNFWIAGKTGPCGPDTEMFYDTRPEEGQMNGKFSDLVKSGRLIEVWNDVFMEYEKKADGTYEKLKKHNVDTGMGLERTLYVISGKQNVFETELFQPIFAKIFEIAGKNCESEAKSCRIIADHIKAATFIISEGVVPANVGRGYVLRRLIRRAVRYGKLLGIEKNFAKEIAQVVVDMYKDFYKELKDNKEKIFEELEKEEEKFKRTLEQGLRIMEKIKWLPVRKKGGWKKGEYMNKVDAKIAFDLYQTYGFPLELIQEELEKKGMFVEIEEFKEEFKKHQELSKTASAGMFKGGLQDTSEQTVKLHTAAHLMLAALRQVLGDHVVQKGSNITPERLRFDFSNPEKMTDEQKAKVEELVNGAIKAKMEVICEEMSLDEARERKAMGIFDSKYGDKVKVYSISNEQGELVSSEICGGPHVKNTGELGHFKLVKEESSSAGVRRIKAVLE
ncbi:MAG TPA: alanine--tRNA ligase, partial [Candidatus Moranbacteria bacterium]|nr:alanine--tRNA ligase [Candidatus Moranbacteria bacterium]